MDYGYKPTTHGRAVLAACMALEKPLHLTRVVVGSGMVPDGVDLADVHELYNPIAEGEIGERTHQDDRLNLTIQYSNIKHQDIPTFYLSEFMVFAKDPETDEETDLLYATLGDYRQPVPAYNAEYPASLFNFPLVLILSDDIEVSIETAPGLITYAELDEAVQNAVRVHENDPNAHKTAIGAAVAEKVTELEESGELVTPEKVAEIAREEIKKHPTGGGYYGSYTVTLAADGWRAATEQNEDYSFVCDVTIADAKSDFVPNGACLPGFFGIAARAGIVNGCDVFNGYVRFYARRVPEADVQGVVILFSKGAGGGIVSGIGAGLEYDGEGNVAVKAGEGVSFDEDGALTVDKQEVITQNDMLDEDETENDLREILLTGNNQPGESGI